MKRKSEELEEDSAKENEMNMDSAMSDDDWDDDGAEGWSEDDDDPESSGMNEAMLDIQMKSLWMRKAKETRKKMIDEQKSVSKWNRKPERRLKPKKKEEEETQMEKFFTPEGVMEILAKQLMQYKQSTKDPSYPFVVTPIDNDIYHWHVKIRNFPSDSKIAHDLQCLSSKYDLDEEVVELRVRFHADIYPFYPPSIRPIRPRLEDMMFCNIVCLEDIQLRNWNPVRRLESVLDSIRKLIIHSGNVDIDNPVNNPAKISEPFTESEFQLAKLSLLTHIPFRSNLMNNVKIDELKPVNFKKKSKPKKEPKPARGGKQAWAAGTGYGHRGDESKWDMEAWEKAQKRKDQEISEILKLVIKDLDAKELSDYNVQLLQKSCLIPFFRKFLDNDSIMDISRHGYLFNQLLEILCAMARFNNIGHLFLDRKTENGDGKCIFDITMALSKKANRILRLQQSDTADGKPAKANETEDAAIELSRKIVKCHELMQKAIEKCPHSLLGSVKKKKPPDDEETKEDVPSSSSGFLSGLFGSSTPAKSGASTPNPEHYCAAMKAISFDEVEKFKKHHYIVGNNEPKGRKVLKRLAAEYSDLESGLPVHWDSSVYFRYLDRNICFAQMIIVPSDGTPYASGCFLFDVMFTSHYPSVPPKVNLQTTGGGSVRFNPNLYNNGKVCLSLLGTWRSANQGEEWNPTVSTFLQVAISIQSLIFVPKPYFNEPGYEQHMGDAKAEAQSNAYNKSRKEATVRWAMVEMLKNPPPEWKTVIQTHFYLQKDRVLKNAVSWLGEGNKLVKELRGLLGKLEAPS